MNILLIKGSNFHLDFDYCIKAKLANEKFKSKVTPRTVQDPSWYESFDLHLYDGQSKMLEMGVCSATVDFVHNAKIKLDLTEMVPEQTHTMVKSFVPSTTSTTNGRSEMDSASIHFLITITGTIGYYHQRGPSGEMMAKHSQQQQNPSNCSNDFQDKMAKEFVSFKDSKIVRNLFLIFTEFIVKFQEHVTCWPADCLR